MTDYCLVIVLSNSLAAPWTAAYQIPLFMGFPKQKFWNGLSFPSPGNLPNLGIKPKSPALASGFFTTEPPGSFHFSLSCIGEGNGNPLQCSCLENPRDSGAWWAAVYGVAQNQTQLKRHNSSSSIDRVEPPIRSKWRTLTEDERLHFPKMCAPPPCSSGPRTDTPG